MYHLRLPALLLLLLVLLHCITAAPSRSHHIEKRKCNTATCVTQRLADFLVRSSNTIGTVYVPTNVGSAAYGKRDLLQPPNILPL
uniref:Calcitonin peptide-like domain-containing protein n=1 Tax=Salarias fasciatus TaxID=181472 RepID=A0A672HIN8_SALFA